MSANDSITTIEPPTGWQLANWGEIWRYRDLFWFLVWRDVKARYAQSVLGIGWALIQPLVRMVVFTVIFGKLAGIKSDGAPYALFSFVALVPWTYFSSALSGAGGSLSGASNMLTKVYFPRLVIPLSAVLSKLIDFFVAFLIIVALLIWYRVMPSIHIWLLPFLCMVMILASAGLGMLLTALGVQYRDIQYAMGFFVQMLMYVSPVVYSTSMIPDKYKLLYALNPMVGVIEGFRAVLLCTVPIPWTYIGIGTAVSIVLFFAGLLYFRKLEKNFADVV